jgi:FKBP-type peptidyl-prolyl cis-trans isomerase 2
VIPVERKYFVDAFSAEPEVGESYTTSDSLWPLKVMNVSGETIYVEQEASPGTAFEGMFGEAEVVAVTNDSLLITENPASVGQIVYSMYGPAKVLRYNNTEIVMDLNPPLAGETLEFDIKLIKLMKG